MIYLDHNATTPIAPEVLEAMIPYLTDEWGNPSAAYRFGSKIKSAIERSREQVAELLGASPGEIVFTSCATEANNAAIHAAIVASGKNHIVTSAVEHSSVLTFCRSLERHGYRVTYLPVNRDGLLNLADVEAAITDDTAIVSLMWANNETGVIFPVESIAQICHSRGALYHCDAVQAVGKMKIDLGRIPISYLSLSGHKINAPKGIGALYVRRKAPFSPLIHGGHQERERRGGTENVSHVIALGCAAELAGHRLANYQERTRQLRDALEEGVLNSIPNTELNGHRHDRLTNTVNLTFCGIEADAMLLLLDQAGICASTGSACLADSDLPSHVLHAMNPDGKASRQALRFSLGAENCLSEVETVIAELKRICTSLREN